MIFIVEDDDSIRELIIYTLQSTGFNACGFASGEEFFKKIRTDTPELVLLDIMLPDQDGISILKQLRSKESFKSLPIIMVTAKGTEYDKVLGLDSGADDYITKPFGMMELVSRIKALLRRTTEQKTSSLPPNTGGISLDTKKHRVFADDKEVILTLKEFELLHYLMENRGIVLSRDKLLATIWGYDFDCETRTIDVHIRTLRQKLGNHGDIIETVRGIGYRIGENK